MDRALLMLFMVSGVISPILSRRRFFIDGADLFEKDGRVLLQAAALGRQFDMGRELCLVTLAGDGSCDHGGAVPIADIVLDDENRSDAALFRADDRGKICIINFTPFDGGV